MNEKIAIIGGGNIGKAIAKGLLGSGQVDSANMAITRRKINLLDEFAEKGIKINQDNKKAVLESEIIIIAVEPKHLVGVLQEIRGDLDHTKHIVVSIVSGVSISEIAKQIGQEIPVIRAMPNTAVAIGESMTCLASLRGNDHALETVKDIFDLVGKTIIIDEEQMVAATVLGACGIAFFLRAIRSASQGGIEIGFHFDEAYAIAAQTAKGAASLLLEQKNHPEIEIDKVTTPRGCTISGLNEMEHRGFSSAMIKGITTSASKLMKIKEND